MEKYEVLLPSMGEGIFEATIIKWLKKEGDLVVKNDSLVEISTDKVDSDIISEKNGTLIKIYKKVHDIVQIGEVIAEIKIVKNITSNSNTVSFCSSNVKKKINKKNFFDLQKSNFIQNFNKELYNCNIFFLSPLIKSIIKKENITYKELNSIQGTGLNKRITKTDLMNFLLIRKKKYNKLENLTLNKKNIKKNKLFKTNNLTKVVIAPHDKIIEMDRMRSLTSNYMLESKKISAHVTSFIESDVTNLVLWKKKNYNLFFNEYSQKLTLTPLFVYIIAKAIQDFPMINISVFNDKIIKKKNINIGVAVSLQNGNLIVPVVKNADQLSITDLELSINHLVNKAKNNKLNPNDITEGTYTVTNIGTFGNYMGTPIINQPQVAIMAIGIIKKKVSVIETITGDQIAIRYKIYLSHTYDHRVIDGSLGGMFLKKVSDYLENFDINMKL